MPEQSESRWAARNGAKAIVRTRVWIGLVERGVNVGPAFDRIPIFIGADAAALRQSLESRKGAQ